MPYPRKQSSITKKLNFLRQLCNLACSYMAKHVFNIRLTHFRHLENQSIGFIPDINRILTKYALQHVLDRYLSDGVFPSKCAWKKNYEKTFQRSNCELFSWICRELSLLCSIGIAFCWCELYMDHDQTLTGTVVYLQKDNKDNWSCCYAKIQDHMLTL